MTDTRDNTYNTPVYREQSGDAIWFGNVEFKVEIIDEYGTFLLVVQNIPTTDPHVVGALWANNHVLTLSNG
jgi:hypothetical protein